MLDELERISRLYLNYRSSYDNGSIANPFYECKDYYYYCGLIDYNHSPSLLNGDVPCALGLSRKYGSDDSKWKYVKVLMVNSGQITFDLPWYVYNQRRLAYIKKMAIKNYRDDFDVYRIIYYFGSKYCKLLDFELNPIIEIESDTVEDDNITLAFEVVRMQLDKQGDFIRRLAQVLYASCNGQNHKFMIDMIEDMHPVTSTVHFIRFYKIIYYVKNYGDNDIVGRFLSRVNSWSRDS
jgi:hypothetical protein